MTVALEVKDSAVIISNLALDSPDVIQYFKQLSEEERPRAAVRAFEIGVFCLQRAQLGHSLDFVRAEVDRLINATGVAISQVPNQVQEKLGGDTGPLAPVKNAVKSASDLFEKHLDPARTETTLGRTISEIKQLLNPSDEKSVQKRIETAIASIAKADGELLKAVSAEVEKATKPLQTIIESLKVSVVGQEAKEEALAGTTQKGFEFEEELKPILQKWAALVGAELEHIGPQNLPGDFTLRLKDTAIGPVGLNIVIEARDREDRWGRARIVGHVNEALKQWSGNYGIYVSKTQAGLAQEIGEMSELTCECGPIIACTVTHLLTALRFAVVDYKFRELQRSRREIDAASITGNLARFRTSLTHLTQIKRKVADVENLLGDIKKEADDMRDEMDDTLRNIESVLPR